MSTSTLLDFNRIAFCLELNVFFGTVVPLAVGQFRIRLAIMVANGVFSRHSSFLMKQIIF